MSSASLAAPAKGLYAPSSSSRLITSFCRRTHHTNAGLTQCQAASRGAHLDTSASTSSQPGLIFGLGESGAWDEAGVGHPVVRYYLGDNEQRWFMWYTGRSNKCHNIDDIFPASGSIGVAVSSDGVNWSRGRGSVEGARGEGRSADVGRVLSPNEDSWWWHDTCHMHVSDVQIMSSDSVSSGGTGVYWCFYSGGNFEEGNIPPSMLSDSSSSADLDSATSTFFKREGVTLRPGLAMSQDGRNFARIEADHHTGALFDVGAPGEWDELFIGAPQVVNSGTKDMRMYYHSFDKTKNKYVVGLATSPDGFKWTKQGPIFDGGSPGSNDFDAKGAATRCVVRDIDTKKYFMFYEGIAEDGRRSIGVAISDDGIQNWKRQPEPVLPSSGCSDDQEESEDARWDNGSVGTPCAVSMAKGKWRLYYSGRKTATSGPWEGIGLALSEDDGQPGQLKFKRRSSN
ncbi:hypothetical protein Ndes2526B_g03164 [Nannochloris sp. 'desiccata']